jgi:hypothetical protein
MANRNYAEFRYSLEKKVVDLYAKVTFSSGTSTVARGKGIKSITKDGSVAGKYAIVFDDAYAAFLGFDCQILDATGAGTTVPLARFCYILAVDPAAKTMSIQFTVLANTVVAPANASVAYMHFTFSNSSAL